MSTKIEIAKGAKTGDSTFDVKKAFIGNGSLLHNVCVKANTLIVKSNATLTNCKLFSDGIITIGKDSTIKDNSIINAFKSISIGDRTIIDRDVFVGGIECENSVFKGHEEDCSIRLGPR